MSWPSFDPGFTTAELSAVFSPQRRVEAILDFEGALALALADAGIAPETEAEEVASACKEGVPEPELILASTWEEGTPLIMLRAAVAERVGSEAARWFHHGATTQDAVDTAQMIQATEALGVMVERLTAMAHRLRELTVAHRDLPQMGRTFLQDALGTTFGFRTATWLSAVIAHISELNAIRESLVVQLGGPVGTLEGYGDGASEVLNALANRLGLGVPGISWHTDRTHVLSLAHAVERVALSMAKLGTDVALLSQLGEVKVRSGGSSSMPDKQNPIDSVRAVAAASACTGAVGMLTAAPPHELDRGIGSWHVEWLALPLVFQTSDASVEAMGHCLASLDVDTETMASRVDTDVVADTAQIDAVLKEFDRVLGP